MTAIDKDTDRLAPKFDYDNLNERPPSPFTALARALHPGVRHVAAQIGPYAAEWQLRNAAALGDKAPLWVVLGDSLSQGIGASRFANGWVPRCSASLGEIGVAHRIVNLSFSGARIADVIDRQLSAMERWRLRPALTTVLIGSNDTIRWELRLRLCERFEYMLRAVPPGSLVASMPRANGPLGTLDELIATIGSPRGLVPVPLILASNRRAEDRWHPDDQGHLQLARTFFEAITTMGPAAMRPAPVR